MDGITYQATVVNGQIQLPVSVCLPENGKVLVIVPAAPLPAVRGPRLLHPDEAIDFQLTLKDADEIR